MAYYKFGERVEKKILHGRLAGCWVPARVIQPNEKRMTVGVYMLNHRGYKLSKYHMQVPLCNIRRPQHKYKVKERIFTKILRGRRKGMWIPAMILRINRDQTYDMMVENHRYHQVTKYAVHVPQQYIVPANFTVKKRTLSTANLSISLSKSQRERKSSESKSCSHKYNSGEEKKVSEMKPSVRSLSTSEAKVCNERRISEVCEDDIFSQTCEFLSPERCKSGEPVRNIRTRKNLDNFFPRALSISVEQRRLGSACATLPSVKVHINQQLRPSCYELGFFTKSAADLKIEAHSHQTAIIQQKSFERAKRESIFTDWGDEFEYEGVSPRFSLHPSSEMTDESCFSPRMFSSDDQFPTLPGQCSQINNRLATCSPRTSAGNRNSLSQISLAAKSHHSRKSIMTLGVNGQNMRLNEIGMDTSLDEIARWLAEGSKNKSGDSSARSSRERMVSMMSFRKNNVPILSKKRKKESNRDMLSEDKEYKLSDLLVGTSVDSSKQGLAIFVGPVDGQLSYKVEVFEKKHMPNNNLVSKEL